MHLIGRICILLALTRYSFGFIFNNVKIKKSPPHYVISFPAQERLASLDDGRDRSGSYAIVRISGLPRWVERGRYYNIFRVHQKEGKDIYLNRVNYYQAPEGWTIRGEPYLDNVRVVARVESHFRGPKVRTVKFRSKKHYKRIYGHRPEMTKILIKDIEIFPTEDFSGSWKSDTTTYLLNRIRQLRYPSTLLNKMKSNALKYFTNKELELLGPDPLAHFDPVYNKVVLLNQVASA